MTKKAHIHTHTLSIEGDVPDHVFKDIIKTGNKIIKSFNEENRYSGIVVNCGKEKFKKKKKKIQVNGLGIRSYETFYIKPELMINGTVHTCKTNDETYDGAVGAICMMAEALSGGLIKYTGGNFRNKRPKYERVLHKSIGFATNTALWPNKEGEIRAISTT